MEEKESLDLYIKEGRDRFRLLDKENEKNRIKEFEKEIDVEIENGFKNGFFCDEGLFSIDPAEGIDVKGLGDPKLSATFNEGVPRPSHIRNLASLTRKMKSETYSEKLLKQMKAATQCYQKRPDNPLIADGHQNVSQIFQNSLAEAS